MVRFFQIGGFSMFVVLACGLAHLLLGIYAIRRPTAARIELAERLIKAEIFFSVGGVASNLAMTFLTVASTEQSLHQMWLMCFTGLYESLAPIIMGLTFVALTHVALALAGHRLARQTP